jgi:hypothetical protein
VTDAAEPPPEPPESPPGRPARADAASDPPRTAPDRAGDTAPYEEPERDPADELRHNIRIDRHQFGRTIINGAVHANTVRFDVAGSDATSVLQWWPLLDEFADPPPSFVEPPHFEALRRVLGEQHVVLLTGGGCGNVSAAAAALRAAGHDPVVELTSSPTTQELLASVEQMAADKPTAGIVIPAIGDEALRGFGSAELRRLRAALGDGAALILATRAQPMSDGPACALPTLAAAAPDPAAVVSAHAPAESDVRERALAALALLLEDSPVGPATAVRLVDAARAEPDASPERVVELASGRSDALQEWLAGHPTAEHVAALTAAVTLDGAPSADVDAVALELRHLLEGELEPSSEPRRFGGPDRGWPEDVVGFRRRSMPTYFGVQEAEVVEILPPHDREWLFAQLWDCLGADFRSGCVEWLRSLAVHPSSRVRSGAAVAAGMLFARDSYTAERELLRPWALDGSLAACECAGLALGIPVLLGHDPVPARSLAYKWSEPRSGANRRRTAIAAFGGPLGAFDSGAAAPAQLWRIPTEPRRPFRREDPQRAAERAQLRRAADNALAALVASGAEARQVRGSVVSMLLAQAEEREERERVFGVLPRIAFRLTRGDEPARASLAELLSETEQTTFAELTALLARALDTPPGFASARIALCTLLDALAAGRIDEEVVNEIIRGMKAGARPGRRSALGQQLHRILAVERRGDGARSYAAETVHATFFSTPQEVR